MIVSDTASGGRFNKAETTDLITGATNGIGLESARALNKMGAEIVFIARNLDKAEKLKGELFQDSGRTATSIIADLSLQDEVKKAANEFLSLNKPLDKLR